MKNLNTYRFGGIGHYSHEFNWNDGGSFGLFECNGVVTDKLMDKLNCSLGKGVNVIFHNDYHGTWNQEGYICATSRKEAKKILEDYANEIYKNTFNGYKINNP